MLAGLLNIPRDRVETYTFERQVRIQGILHTVVRAVSVWPYASDLGTAFTRIHLTLRAVPNLDRLWHQTYSPAILSVAVALVLIT